jgi:hypothetical protein
MTDERRAKLLALVKAASAVQIAALNLVERESRLTEMRMAMSFSELLVLLEEAGRTGAIDITTVMHLTPGP